MVSPIRIIRSFLLLFCLVLVLEKTTAAAPDPRQFVHNGGYMVTSDSGLLRYREQEAFIPASTLKILTSLVALETLGKTFRFETHFFVDSSSNLYVKGYGDPCLTSEVILSIGGELARRGIKRLTTLYLDDSSYQLAAQVGGAGSSSNPYDAPNGALGVNFNALPVLVAADGTIGSGEPQTPLIPMMLKAASGKAPGFYRLNINSLQGSRRLPAPLHYAGELFTQLFAVAGITIENGFTGKSVPGTMTPTYIYYGTQSLEEIVRACLQYSNNYIANQLFLACGVKQFGLPATWEKSRRAVELYIHETFGSAQMNVHAVEGSGLSKDNRISPAALVAILTRFKPYSALLNTEHRFLVKTGTLKDVFCYAGYFPAKGALIPFAIMLNQHQNFREALAKMLNATLLEEVR